MQSHHKSVKPETTNNNNQFEPFLELDFVVYNIGMFSLFDLAPEPEVI